jgi:hypothetical protein
MMIAATNVSAHSPTEGEPYFKMSADIAYNGKLYHVSGVQWKLPQMRNVHEVMVFEYKSDGTINWTEKYCERGTTDILAVFYRFTQNREAT